MKQLNYDHMLTIGRSNNLSLFGLQEILQGFLNEECGNSSENKCSKRTKEEHFRSLRRPSCDADDVHADWSVQQVDRHRDPSQKTSSWQPEFQGGSLQSCINLSLKAAQLQLLLETHLRIRLTIEVPPSAVRPTMTISWR